MTQTQAAHVCDVFSLLRSLGPARRLASVDDLWQARTCVNLRSVRVSSTAHCMPRLPLLIHACWLHTPHAATCHTRSSSESPHFTGRIAAPWSHCMRLRHASAFTSPHAVHHWHASSCRVEAAGHHLSFGTTISFLGRPKPQPLAKHRFVGGLGLPEKVRGPRGMYGLLNAPGLGIEDWLSLSCWVDICGDLVRNGSCFIAVCALL